MVMDEIDTCIKASLLKELKIEMGKGRSCSWGGTFEGVTTPAPSHKNFDGTQDGDDVFRSNIRD